MRLMPAGRRRLADAQSRSFCRTDPRKSHTLFEILASDASFTEVKIIDVSGRHAD
jgi:hypothetical protein